MTHLKTLLAVMCVVTVAAQAEAATIAACAGSSSTCTFEGTEYFCEKSCSGGNCTPLPTADGCPGRCSKSPWISCATDGPCTGSGNACINSGPIKACIAGSARAGEACYGDGDCNTVRGNPTTCTVSGASCCDSSALSAVGDGALALCGSNSGTADTITLATPPSGTRWVVCARAGNDTITGGDGEDFIDGGDGNDTLTGNNGTDRIYGGDGDDTIILGAAPYYLGGDDFADGGAGDDDIYGTNRYFGGGDNIIIGGDGNDFILSGSGRDEMYGGTGDDTVANAFTGIGLFADDAIGTLACGGDGNDSLTAWGPAHQCMDGGAGTDTCNYDYHGSATQTSKDVGTARNCETVTGSVISGRPAACGCD